HALQTHPNRLLARADVKQIRLLGLADERARQRACTQPSRFIELSEMRNRLLDDPAPHPNRAHQPPRAMNLAVLLPRRVAQVHGRASKRTSMPLPRGQVGTTRPFQASPTIQLDDSIQPTFHESGQTGLELLKLG